MKDKKHEEDSEHSRSEMLELNVLDMQVRQLEQQAMLVRQQIEECSNIISNLDELKKAKPGKTMLFPFSRDIFVEGKLESSEVIVNVGSKTLARKSIDEAKKTIERQKEKILRVDEEINWEIERIMARINELEKKLA